MAKPKLINQLFYGQSGKIGGYVLKCINGEVYISRAPSKHGPEHVYSEEQLKRQSMFAKVSAWASKHKNDKEFVEAAKKENNPLVRSYNIAMRAAFANPEIMEEKEGEKGKE